MSRDVRIGVIGTSGWAEFMYLSTLHAYPGAELAAICARNRVRAEELAAKFNIPQVFTDYREMIEKGGLDALIVGSPDDLHHEIVLLALQAGLHVMCDKPMALNAQQAREMLEAAQAAGTKHMVLFTFRWMPFFRFVRDLVDQGSIGRCYHAEFRFEMGYARKPEYFWRLDGARANGALGDLGVHMIDMARWLVGDITRVSAHTRTFVERTSPDGKPVILTNDSVFLLTEFANGAHGMIHASLVADLGDRYMQQQVKLYGENGSLEIDIQYEGAEKGVSLYLSRDGQQRFEKIEVPATYWGAVERTQPFGTFTLQPVGVRNFVDAIRADQPVEPDFVDGYKAQQVINAALESDRSGSWVLVADQG